MREKWMRQMRRFWEFFYSNLMQIMTVAGLLLFFVVISTFSSNSYEDAGKFGLDIRNFNEGWTFVYQGERQAVSYLPEKYPVAPGDSYGIENVLPEDLEDEMVLTLHSSRGNLSVFIGGRMVFRYEAKENLVKNMDFPAVMILLFCLLTFVFLATTIDSAAYILAENSCLSLDGEGQPRQSQRVFWAFMLALLSISLLVIGEITALQTLALLASVPLIALQFYLCYAGIRLVKKWGARERGISS